MDVVLNSELKKFARQQVMSGRYDTLDDVVAAGLFRLMQDDENVDFAPGELQLLVDEGESDFVRGDTLTFAQVRRHFEQRRAGTSKKV